jgi:phage terminase small subunit
MSDKPLTPKQARFVAEYLIDLNATQAAIRSGYSAKTAAEQASRLLTNVKIAEAVAIGQGAALRAAGVTAERVMLEAARLAFSDVRGLFDAETGRLLDVSALSEDMARAVASVEVLREKSTRRVGEDTETDTQEQVMKIRVWDKPRSLELLARCLGMLKDRVEHGGSIAFIKKIEHVHEPGA